MWSALTSDLQEFVSTVRSDTTSVLQKIDAGLEEQENNVSTDETSDEIPKIDHGELKEVLSLLMKHPGTYTEPLEDEEDEELVKEFKASFSSEEKAEEITEMLQKYPDLKEQFEELCPTQISFEDFWMRHFYRCDPDRIARQLEEETMLERQARIEAIQGGIKSVASFFGGAVKAVSQSLADEMNSSANENQSSKGFFGSNGRPPFVMNTAVDESLEDDEQNEEEDEEELGWDDDDDDMFDDRPETVDADSEQIEFTDKRAEDLEERLKQALEERDMMKHTVEMQTKEISALKTNDTAFFASNKGSETEIEALKLKLFEKESELAAMRASQGDADVTLGEQGDKVLVLVEKLKELTKPELNQIYGLVFSDVVSQEDGNTKTAALEKQVQEMSERLSSKETELSEIEKSFQDSEQKLAEALQNLQLEKSQKASASTSNDELKRQLDSAQKELMQSKSDKESMQAKLAQADEHHRVQVQDLQQAMTTLSSREMALNADLSKCKQDYEEALSSIETLKMDLKAKEDSTSPSSLSTGEVIESTPLVAKLDIAGGDDDDWGDDWD